MRFAVDEQNQAVGADESLESRHYYCAACQKPVIKQGGDFFHHVAKDNGSNCGGAEAGLKLAAKQQLKTSNRIRLPEMCILVCWPGTDARSLREVVQVTEEKAFHPFGIELDATLSGEKVDVLYEAGEWQLGIVLKAKSRERLDINLGALQGKRAGLLSIDLEMIELVQGEDMRTWREQIKTALALGGGNKSWLYHPRAARVRQRTEERLERHWAFKHDMARNQPAGEGGGEATRHGARQKYRCSCGSSFMGRTGISSLCPDCKLPSAQYAVAVEA